MIVKTRKGRIYAMEALPGDLSFILRVDGREVNYRPWHPAWPLHEYDRALALAKKMVDQSDCPLPDAELVPLDARETLESAGLDPDAFIASLSAEELEEYRVYAVTTLRDAMLDPDPDLRRAAAEALDEMRDSSLPS